MNVAVIGAGVVGLATTAALLARGAAVTCFEAAGPMSQRSAGQSRIFRLAHPIPELVGLADAARREWQRWSELAGRELIRPAELVVTGADVPRWAAAMAAAGADNAVTDGFDSADAGRAALPVRSVPGPYLFDPAGGVLDVVGTGELLRGMTAGAVVLDTVYRLELIGSGARVWSGSGRHDVDGVVLVAGAGTCALAAQVGLYTPSGLAHHVRMTFPLADPTVRPSCLIERSESWRPGFTTYQHLVAPGRWAVGAHFGADAVAWEVGREPAVERSRRIVLDYVRENLDGVEDRIVDELYCTVLPSWSDGFGALRNDAVVTLYGDNLFKLAPVLGELLADAVLTGSPVTGMAAPVEA